MPMRILLIGDIVGKPGRQIVERELPKLRGDRKIDLVIANAENAADGSGLTAKTYRQLMAAEVDCITMGDHIYRKLEIESILKESNKIVKPANYPPTAPGRDWMVVPAADGTPIGVFSLLGRVFMRPVDCPWQAAERVVDAMPDEVRIRVLDFHAEATSDMQLMGRALDGRVSAVLGTHTHVTTADEQILPGGTAFQCDVGMTGAHASILGREVDPVMQATLTFRPVRFDVARNDVRLSATLVEVDRESGHATSIERISVRESE